MERHVAVQDESTFWKRWWTPLPLLPTDTERIGGRRWPVAAVVFLLPVAIPAIKEMIHSPGPVSPALVVKLVLVLAYGACYVVFPRLLFRERSSSLQVGFAAVSLAIGWALVLLGGNIYLLTY